MKISILTGILYLASANALAQASAINLTGKWKFAKIEMEGGMGLDMDNVDSSRKVFMQKYKDEAAAAEEFKTWQTHMQNTVIIFNADSSFVTNFFSNQVDSVKGVYSYNIGNKELCLKTGNILLNHNLTQIHALTNTELVLGCKEQNCEIKMLYFRKW